jgi:hypothetical protein
MKRLGESGSGDCQSQRPVPPGDHCELNAIIQLGIWAVDIPECQFQFIKNR